MIGPARVKLTELEVRARAAATVVKAKAAATVVVAGTGARGARHAAGAGDRMRMPGDFLCRPPRAPGPARPFPAWTHSTGGRASDPGPGPAAAPARRPWAPVARDRPGPCHPVPTEAP